MVQNYPKKFKIVKLFEILFPIVQYDPIWSIMVQNYIIWSLMVQHIPILQKNEKKKKSKLSNVLQNSSKLSKWSKIVKYCFKKKGFFIPPKKYKTVKKKFKLFSKMVQYFPNSSKTRPKVPGEGWLCHGPNLFYVPGLPSL